MDGFLNITHRKNGVTQSVEGHTSNLEILRDMEFLNGGDDCESLKFLNQLPKQTLKPSGYGLVVVDFEQKWIGHSQEYTNPESFSAARVALDSMYQREKNRPEGRNVYLEKAWNSGALKNARWFSDDGDIHIVSLKDSGIDTFEKLLDCCQNSNRINPLRIVLGGMMKKISGGNKKTKLFEILFEPQGWTIQRFEGTPEGWIDFGKSLVERNFDIMGQIQDWVNFIEEKFDDDALDENPGLTQKPSEQFQSTLVELIREKFSNEIPSGFMGKTKPRIKTL